MVALSFGCGRRWAIAVAAAIVGCGMLSQPATWAQAQQQPTSSMIGKAAPFDSLSGATGWINSKDLRAKDLKGKVVLVDFWAYSCINCLRSLPYIEAWSEKYKDSGLVVIGVHTPEFGFGTKLDNVQRSVRKFHVTFPVALDSDYAIWKAFHNEYWPADYFIDAHGKIRYTHFGEGDYAKAEELIQGLLKERGQSMPEGTVSVQGTGIEAPADMKAIQSPETYVGYARAANFASPGGIKHDDDHVYEPPANPSLNQWGFAGKWVDHQQVAELKEAGGKIIFHFHARDLHLVLGPAKHDKPVRFKVTIDGKAPGENHGVDTDAEGNGEVKDYRLYQLVRQKGPVEDHIFTIEFEDPGVQAFAFTFG
ncbi:MAG: redoxin family protein [Acidobacteriaceae bacterium]